MEERWVRGLSPYHGLIPAPTTQRPARLSRTLASSQFACSYGRTEPRLSPVGLRIETPRLVVRPFTEADGEAWLALVDDPDVRRYTPPRDEFTPDTFREVLERRRRLEQERGFAMWAVDRRESGEFIGQCGFYLSENTGPEIEIAYHYVPASWGQGIGTEAAQAVLSYGFGTLGLEEVIALVIQGNVGSSRVAEKAGMTFVSDEATYYHIPHLLKYVARREPWLAAHSGTPAVKHRRPDQNAA